MINVAVLGAGINGLACAVKIQEKYPEVYVTIFANEFTPDTTGDGSGGLWFPYLCSNTPNSFLTKWGIETYQYIHELWKEGGHDISLMPVYQLHRKERDLLQQSWMDLVFGYRSIGKKELESFNSFSTLKYVAGQTFTTFIAYPPTIIGYLYGRFMKGNGKVIQAKLTSLEDPRLGSYDVVVNCTGLGARDLVPDSKVFAIRGQIMKVDAPWITYTVLDDSGHYIIPNTHTCVLGGTHQENDYNYSVNDEDTAFIRDGCRELILGLKNAGFIKHWVGLRPGRIEVRLEAEEKDGRLYIHNYGHGGSGLTLFWGCSSDVLDIFNRYMEEGKRTVKSKL